MATTLVSTGIQFPDSSTQTTRAGWIPLTLYNAFTQSASITGIPDGAKAIKLVATMSYNNGPSQPTIIATHSSGNYSLNGNFLSNLQSQTTVSGYTAGTSFIPPQSYYNPSKITIDIQYQYDPASSVHSYGYETTSSTTGAYLVLGQGSMSASGGFINGFSFATNAGSVYFNNLVAQVYYQM